MAKPQRWMAVWDTHGDMIDPGAAKVAREFAKFFKPDIRIHGGDYCDFRPFRRGASDQERRESIEKDIDAAKAFFVEFKPTHILNGNHDHRIMRVIEGDDAIAAAYGRKVLGELLESMGSAVRFPWDKRKGIFQLGDQRFIHGYHGGITAARQAALVYGNVMQGHVHAIDTYSIPAIEKRVGRTCGCLCKLDMDYNAGHVSTLRQAHGFAYGFVYPGGTTKVFQADSDGGSWIFPSEFREVRV